MTINSRPERPTPASDAAFLNRAAEQETMPIHCWIPTDLHQWVKIQAATDHSNMTALVVEALTDYRNKREP